MGTSTSHGITDAVRLRISTILRSDAAQKVDFYLDSIHVDGSGFMFLALALLSPPRGAHGLSITIGGLNPLAAATYNPATNTFQFPTATYGLDPFERMTILHECVHAWRDSLGRAIRTSGGGVVTRAVSDEATAYVAGALFSIFEEGSLSTPSTTPTWAQDDGIYSCALGIALRIAGSSNPTGRNLNSFDPAGVGWLKDFITSSPTYQHLRHSPTMSYDNNGVRL